MAGEKPLPTCYEILQVLPAAPLDLITAAYWRLAGQVQTRRASDPTAETVLYYLTRAYQILADPRLRAEYDASIGVTAGALPPKLPGRTRRRLSSVFRRTRLPAEPDMHVDYYDILRVSPSAEASILSEAYAVLKNYYVRLVHSGQAPPDLVNYLEEAYTVMSDPEGRRHYDSARNRAQRPDAEEKDPSAVGLGSLETSTTTTGTADIRAPDGAGQRALHGPPHEFQKRPPRWLAAFRLRRPVEGTPASETVTQEERAAAVPPLQAAPGNGTPWQSAIAASTDASERVSSRRRPALVALVRLAWRLTVFLAVHTSSLARSTARQFASLSRREIKQARENLARRAQERRDLAEAEEVLLRRLSSTVDRPAVAADTMNDINHNGEPVARLTLLEGPGCGAIFDLEHLPLTLGGGAGCDVQLPGLPSQQARLLYRDGRFVVYNLEDDSDGGSSVPWWILESGDDLTLGPYKLRFTAGRD